MKAKMIKLIILLILDHSIQAEKLKCYEQADFTKNGEENEDKRTTEKECLKGDVCISAKGSYTHLDNNCEFLNI